MKLILAEKQPDFFTLMRIRRDVFIKEQQVDPDIEMDTLDDHAMHFILIEKEHDIIGTCRVIINDDTCKIGRVAIVKEKRSLGYGSFLMKALEQELKAMGFTYLYLDAQLHASSFYKNCGFQEIGDIFIEAGIKHIKMEKNI